MAVWYPSALISDIRGKLGNQVFTFYRGTHVIRTYVIPAQPNNADQQRCRGNVSDVAGSWAFLTDGEKELWEKYASLARIKGGFAAYMRHNVRLAHANHPELHWISHPPLRGGTPRYPRQVQMFFDGSCYIHISWSHPTDTIHFIQPFYRLDYDYSITYHPHWKLIATVRSDAGELVWQQPYGTGTRIHIYLRTLDRWGRVSPRTEAHTLIVP